MSKPNEPMVCTQRCPSAARIRRLLVAFVSPAITPAQSHSGRLRIDRLFAGESIRCFSGCGTRGKSDLLDWGFVPGLSLVGVHTEVGLTEHLRLPSVRVRGIRWQVLVPEKQGFPCA